MVKERRAGDPAVLVASNDKAIRTLGWKIQYPKVEDMILSAWNWHQSHPNGYRDDE